MQDALRRKIGIAFIVLAVFGFFYFRREKLSDYYLDRAERARVAGDEEGALRNFVLGAALKERGGSGEAAAERAETFFARGDFASAEKELTEALSEAGASAQIYGLLGRVKNAQGEYEQAEGYYSLAAGEGGGAALALERAKNLVRAGNFLGAESVLSSAPEWSSDEDVIYYLALVRANSGRFSSEDFTVLKGGEHEEHIVLIEDFFAGAYPASATDVSLVARADLFRRVGAVELALANLDIVLGRSGRYRDAYLVSGKTFLGIGNQAAAQEAFEKALLLDGDSTEAIFYLKKIYEAAGNQGLSRELEGRYENLAG